MDLTKLSLAEIVALFTPEALDKLTPEQETELRTAARERFDAITDSEAPTVEELDIAEALGTGLDVFVERDEALAAEQQKADDRLAALRERKAARDKAEADAAEGDEEGDEPTEDEEGDEPAESDEGAEGVETQAPEGQGAEGQAAPVAASARRRITASGKARKPAAPETQPVTKRSGIAGLSLVAAGAVREKRSGDDLSQLEVAEEILAISQTFSAPSGTGEGVDIRRFPTAKVNIDYPDELVVMGDNAEDAINAATNQSRLKGGSLVAAGGWCAPSEIMYDLEVDATRDGMLSLPEVAVRRGGVRWPVNPDFAQFYANPGFKQTEAQAIAGTTKPCVEVTCVGFQEKRLDVEGLCIKVPILTSVGYPEVVKNFFTNTLIAHDHWINNDVIAQVDTAAGAARVVTGLGSSVNDLLGALGLLLDQEIQKYKLGFNQTMEILLPFWVKKMLKTELGRRGNRSEKAVTDAELNAWFAAYNVAPQWLADWQPLNETAVAYPATFNVIVYPAGVFFKGVAPVISLDTIYDAASLAQNVYTGLFTEQGYMIGKKKLGATKLTIPTSLAGRMGRFDYGLVNPAAA